MNRFERIDNLIGQEKRELLAQKTVMVVGLGGVGGYAVESLCRSGIGKLIIIDKDEVDISNINRQIIALSDSVGQSKSKLFSERIKAINPDAVVIEHQAFLNQDNITEFFNEKVDFVVDAIDTMSSKVALWKYLQKNNIPFISALGMARRLNPQNLTITTLDKTFDDPMARSLRYQARKNGVSLKIPVVFCQKQPLEDSSAAKESLGSMIFVPAYGGLLCGYYVISQLIDSDNK
ncbi:MAG: ThiF family adenylyltransferase [Erysipelotrichaceae bacterium]